MCFFFKMFRFLTNPFICEAIVGTTVDKKVLCNIKMNFNISITYDKYFFSFCYFYFKENGIFYA